MYKLGIGKLMYLVALTPIHAGVGRIEGAYVDLPVQRDEFGFPSIWATSLKGAFKSNLYARGIKWVSEVLGSEPGEGAETRPSLVSFLDARLLVIPAKSLEGIWLYISSPHTLRIINSLREALGYEPLHEAESYYDLKEARVSSDEFYVTGRKLVVNEIDVEADYDKGLSELLGKLLGPSLEELKKIGVKPSLLLVPDRLAPDLVKKSLLIQYRVCLERDTKRVKNLWSEEYVPQFTVFASGVLFKEPLEKTAGLSSAEDVKNKLVKESPSAIQLGGKETVGKGIMKVVWG